MKSIGIPKTIESKDSEHDVCKIFNSFDFDLGEDRIEVSQQVSLIGS